MRTLDLPKTLIASLATANHSAIHEARFAMANDIERRRREKANQVFDAASALITTKPIPAWTTDDHLIFMEASGDTRMPDGIQPKALPEQRSDEIPF